MRTKTQVNRLGLYDDVRRVLDAAMQSGGGEFELPTHGMAVHWRQRAYKFRKLYAQILASDDSFSMSPYDRLTMPQLFVYEDCKKRGHENCICSRIVIIKVREAVGTFVPNREPIIPAEFPVPGDELLDVAKQIAAKIKEGDL